jgi:hypothetical protein
VILVMVFINHISCLNLITIQVPCLKNVLVLRAKRYFENRYSLVFNIDPSNEAFQFSLTFNNAREVVATVRKKDHLPEQRCRDEFQSI